MKKIINTSVWVLFCTMTTMLSNCGGNGTTTEEPKPLNITVYIDLSNRLVLHNTTPDPKTKDLAVIDMLTDCLAEKNKGPALLKSNDKMKVLCYPAPNHPDIIALTDSLTYDLSKLKAGDKLHSLSGLKNKFHNNLSRIYDIALEQKDWKGSDIWGFFSDPTKVDVQCIEKDARNVLFVLTDGYIYQRGNAIKNGHEYSYILEETLKDSESSLIVKRDGLDNLEVYVLELSPTPLQREKMFELLRNWLSGMGVQKTETYETDVPANIRAIVQKIISEE